MKFPLFFQRIGAGFLDVAFPASCASCGDALENPPLPHVCRRCFSKIHIVEDPRCLTCGYPFFGEVESHGDCQHCARLTPRFARGWSIALFRGPIRRLIYALKYEKALWALRDLGRIAEFAEGLGDYLEDAILVPVPLHSRKLRERGYNQSALITEELSRRFEVQYRDDLLSRIVDTESQTRFNRQERYRNLKNAFIVVENSDFEIKQRYVLVDDVFTTGSTLNACAAALRKSGVKEIDVLTIGHG
jgi:competence protein ComFC